MTSLSPLAEAFRAVLRDRRSEMLVMAPSESRTLTAQDIDAQACDFSAALAALRLSQGHLVVTKRRQRVGDAGAGPRLPARRADADAGGPQHAAGRTRCARLALGRSRRGRARQPRPAPSVGRGDGPAMRPGRRRRRVRIGHGLAAWMVTPLPAPGRHAPAAVLRLTSGSTGEPRVTCTEERHLVADVVHITEAMDIRPAHEAVRRDSALALLRLRQPAAATALAGHAGAPAPAIRADAGRARHPGRRARDLRRCAVHVRAPRAAPGPAAPRLAAPRGIRGRPPDVRDGDRLSSGHGREGAIVLRLERDRRHLLRRHGPPRRSCAGRPSHRGDARGTRGRRGCARGFRSRARLRDRM